MAEAVVSVLVEHSVSKVLEKLEQEVRLVSGVKQQVQALADKFRTVRAVLGEAEKRQVEELPVKIWLGKLKDAAYDMDDVLDEWNTRFQVQGVQHLLSTNSKVCSFVPFSCFCFNRVTLRRSIAIKIASLNERLGNIYLEKEDFKFNSSATVKEDVRSETTTFFDVPKVCGRGSDKDVILKQLLPVEAKSTTEAEGNPFIVSIVGTGGIGKTTLAQLCFNDEKVKSRFEKRMWVSCDPFDEIRVAKSIVEELEGNAPNLNSLNALLNRINELIKDKSYLLVLDDVWSEDEKKWGPLKNSLMSASNGSKVLITTRSERVAIKMGTSYKYVLSELSEKDSWLLFKETAFSGKQSGDCEKLEEIGKEIVKKCKGLPLVVQSVGSLLRLKDREEEWQSILSSEVWESEVVERYICPPLLLSYYDLPPAIKQCFLYCAIFPKGERIDRARLIHLWMAQGYLNSRGNEEMERTGRDFFSNLASRSFFQNFERDEVDGSIIRCTMHDLVHDFVKFLAGDEFVTEMDGDAEELRLKSFTRQTRHLILMNGSEGCSMIKNKESLRSLLFVSCSIAHTTRSEVTIQPGLFHQVKCLRALDFSGTKLPGGVRNLIHLRCLDLSCNMDLRELPDEICELYNLQTLKINGCCNLKKLPAGGMMGKLTNLRHFELKRTNSLQALPKGIAVLTNLQTLSKFVVSDKSDDGGSCGIGDLGNLKRLRSLGISGLGNVGGLDEIEGAELNRKIQLMGLELCFSEIPGEMISDAELLGALRPPTSLERLQISWFKGPVGSTFFSNWMGWLPNLKKLVLRSWRNCDSLPPLGRLPSLEILKLKYIDTVKMVGSEFLGLEIGNLSVSFPKLKRLTFKNMNAWEEWNGGHNSRGVKIMPCLSLVEIIQCDELKTLPDFLPTVPIQKLYINEGHRGYMEELCKDGEGKYWPIVSHIPDIDITSVLRKIRNHAQAIRAAFLYKIGTHQFED